MTKVEEMSEEKFEVVNRHAVAALEVHLQDLADKYGDEDYELQFIGDLYARLIVSIYMGYLPEKIAKEAEGAASRLMKMSGVAVEEVEDEQD